MIKTYNFLWLRLADYAKKYQSGFDTEEEFNGKLSEVQLELMNDLSPYYPVNEKVRGILEPFVRKATGSSTVTGRIDKPENFNRVLALRTGNIPVSPTNEGELVMSSIIPQRRPNIIKGIVNYLTYENKIQLTPEVQLQYELYYLIYPPEAKIAFTYTIDPVSGEDTMTVDLANTIDLVWDKNAANIILYMMMEKYGVSSREDLIREYGRLGINLSIGAQQ